MYLDFRDVPDPGLTKEACG